MKKIRRFLLVSAASVLLGVSAHAQMPGLRSVFVNNATGPAASAEAQQFKCSGAVADAAGHPLAGATVEYWRYKGDWFAGNSAELVKQITTEANGAFAFQVSRMAGFLLARKPGLAPAWKFLGQPFNPIGDMEESLVLTPPAALAGRVVDQTDKPLANAEVFVTTALCEILREDGGRSLDYLFGMAAHDCFGARTDAAGRFRIENFPTNATAALAVKAPGLTLSQEQQNFSGWNSLPWRAGQEDIKLVVEPAGSIEGKIIVEQSNQPPPAAQLTLQSDNNGGFFGFGQREQAQSGPDGAFRINDVPAGSYRIQALFGTNAVPDWVAETVPVSVESGQLTRDAQVIAVRGGGLEVAVLGQNDHKPQAQVSVNAYKQNFQSSADSDSNGIAFLRLPPGDYQIMASRASMPGNQNQTSASVEAGKTNRVEIEIAAPLKIAGVLRQPDGQPAVGMRVRLVGGFGGPETPNVKTDAGGKFELEWNPRRFGQNETTACVLARDAEHNLAVAQDIDEETGPLDLKLAPGLTLAGRVESGGKPVTNATVALMFWTGNRGMPLAGLNRATNMPGRFEIPAIPPGRKYGVRVSAPGYGQKIVNDVAASAEAGRMELDPFELKPANLKLAGQVLDADDKPVAGGNVSLFGEGQPNANARTDREGRFRFDHVCEGSAQLQANSQNSYGNVSAEGGDTNVVLHLGQNSMAAAGSTAHKLKGTVTDAEGKPVAGAQVEVFPSFNGSQWKKTATNGAFSLTWSLQPWQMQNSGVALLVARDTARNLAATEELPEETTNLDVKLKPALTVAGVVKNTDDSPLAGAEVGVWLKTGNMYNQLDDKMAASDAQGAYEIKCLPADGSYIVFASAKGHGRSQQQVPGDAETNRLELSPFVLKLADRVLAGQVLNENDKPVSGAYVNLNGEDQPNGNVTTDSKGRFHFKVCEGQIRLFANSSQGGGFGQATAEAGDTNVVLTLGSQPGMVRQAPARASLKGAPLPDLAGVNLAGDAAPAGQPVLLCLFDAGQRSSRHVVHQLDQQAAALRQQGVTVLGVQAVVTGGEIFNEWKSASPVSFPLGRAAEKSEKTKWATSVPALPWLILTDAHHRIVAEGFTLDELDAQLKNLPK
jgi:protocatechuate 3,4-dioxygenase beta subunit